MAEPAAAAADGARAASTAAAGPQCVGLPGGVGGGPTGVRAAGAGFLEKGAKHHLTSGGWVERTGKEGRRVGRGGRQTVERGQSESEGVLENIRVCGGPRGAALHDVNEERGE